MSWMKGLILCLAITGGTTAMGEFRDYAAELPDYASMRERVGALYREEKYTEAADILYPLFIALHGGGETIAELRPSWTSAILTREFIVPFVQSLQVISMTGFT